jgi:hypothetical protein
VIDVRADEMRLAYWRAKALGAARMSVNQEGIALLWALVGLVIGIACAVWGAKRALAEGE